MNSQNQKPSSNQPSTRPYDDDEAQDLGANRMEADSGPDGLGSDPSMRQMQQTDSMPRQGQQGDGKSVSNGNTRDRQQDQAGSSGLRQQGGQDRQDGMQPNAKSVQTGNSGRDGQDGSQDPSSNMPR